MELKLSGNLLARPGGEAWFASSAGVGKATPEGEFMLLSSSRVQQIFANKETGAIVAVGAHIEVWNGQRFEPVLFDLPGDFPETGIGHPIDVVVDDSSTWWILYSTGRLLRLKRDRTIAELYGDESGIPPSTRSLLFLPDKRRLLLGTRDEGLFELLLP